MTHWRWGQSEAGIIQMAYIVEDLRASMSVFSRDLGIGPWFVIEHFPFRRLSYRGVETSCDLSLCLGVSGGMMYELIEQHDGNASVYTETRDARGWGFHHYAVAARPDGYDALLQGHLDRGAALALDAEVGVGGRAAYVDTGASLFGMIELIEMTPDVENLFDMIHQAAKDWDGSDPVRVLG